MTKRAFIIHGWDGYPEEGVFPWLKEELQKRGFAVYNPAMPEPLRPRIETWVGFLAKQVGAPDENTFVFGHSVGGQTVLRYLAGLGTGQRIGGIVLLAPWVMSTDQAYEDEDDIEVGRPWLETPIDWEGVKRHTDNITAIFSDNDPLVPLSASDMLKEKLDARIVIEHEKGHFSGSDGVTELPSALEAVLEMAK